MNTTLPILTKNVIVKEDIPVVEVSDPSKSSEKHVCSPFVYGVQTLLYLELHPWSQNIIWLGGRTVNSLHETFQFLALSGEEEIFSSLHERLSQFLRR